MCVLREGLLYHGFMVANQYHTGEKVIATKIIAYTVSRVASFIRSFVVMCLLYHGFARCQQFIYLFSKCLPLLTKSYVVPWFTIQIEYKGTTGAVI